MKKFGQFGGCALFTLVLTALAMGEDSQPQKIALTEVPAKVLEAAGEAEQRVEWSQVLRKPRDAGAAAFYVLQGRIVIRAQREQITSDGDIEVIPGLSESVEICVREDGKLNYVVKSLPLAAVPAEVMQGLKTKIDVSPNVAFAVRTSAQGKPNGYIFWIDQRGLLQYTVSADGKSVEKL
jgi:hypothetical protein